MKIPGGFASTEMDLAAVRDSQGYLCVLDLRSGKQLARSEGHAVPLLVEAQRIFGYRFYANSAIDVFAARLTDGELREIWSTRFSIPDWVEEPDTPCDGFTIDAHIDGAELRVSWNASVSHQGGAPPPIDIEPVTRREARGFVCLALDDGHLVSEDDSNPATDDLEPVPPKPPPGRTVVAYRDGTTMATRAWQTSVHKAFLSRPAGAAGISLMHELAQGSQLVRDLTEDVNAEATVTAEGRLVFVREGTGADVRWRVFSTENASSVATLPFDPGTVELASEGNLVFALVHENRDGWQNIELRCRSLRDGAPIWSFTLGEREIPMPKPFPR